MNTKVELVLRYEPHVSVNKAYNANNQRLGIKQEAETWLWELRLALNQAIATRNLKLPGRTDTVVVDLRVVAPQGRGRLPDTPNFRKLINDVVAAGLGMDDQPILGRDFRAVRAEAGKNGSIGVSICWKSINSKSIAIRDDSKTAHGPISKDMKRRLGLQHCNDLCVGYGSAYCYQVCTVDVPLDCPVTFNPGLYDENAPSPCAICKKSCPCLRNTVERVEAIDLWWGARVKSTKFRRLNWS